MDQFKCPDDRRDVGPTQRNRRRVPRPGCEWEERPRFDPPPSMDEVVALDARRASRSPNLVGFFADTGGVVGMSVHNGYWLGDVVRLTRAIQRGDFPREVGGEMTIPVATDGGGNAFLMSSVGRVWRWDHETGDRSVVADSSAHSCPWSWQIGRHM